MHGEFFRVEIFGEKILPKCQSAAVVLIALTVFGLSTSASALDKKSAIWKEFRQAYHNKMSVRPEDLDVLSSDMLRSLHVRIERWNARGLTGFARKLSHHHYLFVVTESRSLGQRAKAIIVRADPRMDSPSELKSWYPLFVPIVWPDGRIWTENFISAPSWNEDENALVSKFCNDVVAKDALYHCHRSFYRLNPTGTSLLRIEVRNMRTQKWITAWKDGVWKIDFKK